MDRSDSVGLDGRENSIDLSELVRLMESFTLATGLGARYVGETERIGSFCAGCGEEQCRLSITNAGRQAVRFGEPYIAECHAKRFTITAPLMIDGRMAGAVECGPLNIRAQDPEEGLKPITGKGVLAAADLLFLMVRYAAQSGLTIMRQQKAMADQQAIIGELVQVHKARGESAVYPLDMERELLAKMRLGDRAGARSILNQILGRIFFLTSDVEVIKARVLELAVILSRSAAEQGAGQYMGLDHGLIRELSGASTFEEVCAWLVVVLDSYLDALSRPRVGKTSAILDEALAIIRKDYALPLTLESVAAKVHVSSFYLAHLLKQSLGFTFTDYLARVRVEEARVRLLSSDAAVREIARSVGYADAGYFARVFRRATGMTPREYRGGGAAK